MSHAGTNCAPDIDRVSSGAQNLWDATDFSGAQIFSSKNKKSLDVQIYSRIDTAMKKL